VVDYLNFYENVAEANIRLQNTTVLYDGEPYYVLCFDDSKPDGIIRIYMEPIGYKFLESHEKPIPYSTSLPPGKTRGDVMDEYMKACPDSRIIRKQMNSPLFNRFRPFPLGMCNSNGYTYYCERSPVRHTQQGLTNSMIHVNTVTLNGKGGVGVSFTGKEFRDCIVGEFPSVDASLGVITSPGYEDTAVGFSREFAFVRGPVDTAFLAYKKDIVGSIPNGDKSRVILSKKFDFVKEAVIDLKIFEDIRIK
jgi:hypothetical protein